MGMTKNDAIGILIEKGHRTTQWMASVLLTAPQFSRDSARRLKYMAIASEFGTRFDLTLDWEPVVDCTVLSWESLDLIGKSLFHQEITILQFNEMVKKFGKYHAVVPQITPGIKKFLAGFLE